MGRVQFCGLALAVGPGVFIPRQRTAELVRLALDDPGAVLLEACAGVAPIASVVGRTGVEVHACDIDPVALGYARRNLPAGAGVWCGTCWSRSPPTSWPA